MWSKMNVEYVNHMGNDLDVVNAARVSFNKTSHSMNIKDDKLIQFLAKHNHFTPFTHVVFKLRVKVPIFVARQWFKHTVGFSYNEVSRRYVSDPPELYKAAIWRGAPEEHIKQGSSSKVIYVTKETDKIMEVMVDHYNTLIKQGIAPEMARMVLPQGAMTEFIVTGSLAAWARFYELRSDCHAQHEIRWCAQEVSTIIAPCCPSSWDALTNKKECNNG